MAEGPEMKHFNASLGGFQHADEYKAQFIPSMNRPLKLWLSDQLVKLPTTACFVYMPYIELIYS